MALIVLGLFNGLVFLPVLLVIVGPPAQVEAVDQEDSLPPSTPQPSPVRFKARPPKLKSSHRGGSSSSGHGSHDNNGFSSIKHKRHNSDISLSTIAEENSHCQSSIADTASVSSGDSIQDPASVQSSFNGTSVFLEPHITVETSTVPANVSLEKVKRKIYSFSFQFQGSSTGSSRSASPSGAKVTKVTATAKFKLELHTPMESGSSRPSSRRSRRGSSSSKNGDSSVHSSLELPSSSVSSSLSSDGGFSEK